MILLGWILIYVYLCIRIDCFVMDGLTKPFHLRVSPFLKLQDSLSSTKNQDVVSAKEVIQQKIQRFVLISSMFAISGAFTSVSSVLAEEIKKKGKKPKVLETDLGIKFIELKKGSGAYPVDGDFVIVSYNAFLNNGTLFDSTESKSRKPISFRMGKKQVIPGIESVVSYMQAGGEVTCTIPSKYAYGEKGVCLETGECLVPPNETLKYYLKLISVGNAYN